MMYTVLASMVVASARSINKEGLTLLCLGLGISLMCFVLTGFKSKQHQKPSANPYFRGRQQGVNLFRWIGLVMAAIGFVILLATL